MSAPAPSDRNEDPNVLDSDALTADWSDAVPTRDGDRTPDESLRRPAPFDDPTARFAAFARAAREMLHGISNDLTAAVAAIELLQLRGGLPSDAAALVDQAAEGLTATVASLRAFQQFVREQSRQTTAE